MKDYIITSKKTIPTKNFRSYIATATLRTNLYNELVSFMIND